MSFFWRRPLHRGMAFCHRHCPAVFFCVRVPLFRPLSLLLSITHMITHRGIRIIWVIRLIRLSVSIIIIIIVEYMRRIRVSICRTRTTGFRLHFGGQRTVIIVYKDGHRLVCRTLAFVWFPLGLKETSLRCVLPLHHLVERRMFLFVRLILLLLPPIRPVVFVRCGRRFVHCPTSALSVFPIHTDFDYAPPWFAKVCGAFTVWIYVAIIGERGQRIKHFVALAFAGFHISG
mmetsp:Transcript_40352/g.66284  ORF Transcript_40352/g.66284 Transcript_40352/m.66284 type:complete len:231 (-) Transcript_40352:276-968(-)